MAAALREAVERALLEAAELLKEAVNNPAAASAVVLYFRPYTFGQTSSMAGGGQVD